MAGKPKKAIRPSRLELDPRIFNRAKGETHEKLVNRILTNIKLFDFHGRYDLLKKMAAHPSLPKEFSPVYGKGTEFHRVQNIRSSISQEGHVFWLLGMLRKHHVILRKFFELKTTINAKILKGDAYGALQNLALTSELSESWWAIELAIHINKEILGNDTKDHVKRLQEIYPSLNLARLTRDFLLLSESNSVGVYIECVLGRVKEYNSSNVDGAIEDGAAESSMLLPLYFDCTRTPTLKALYTYQTWSLFDQYLLLRSVFFECSPDTDDYKKHSEEILELANLIGDFELQNTLLESNYTDPSVQEIVRMYTHGNYAFVISEIAKLLAEESPKVFGLIEIYARSKIYTSSLTTSDTFYDQLAIEFAGVLILDVESSEKAAYLRKISTKFRGEPWAKSLLYHIACIKPWRSSDENLEMARLQLKCLGSYGTPKTRVKSFELANIRDAEPSLIPKYRAQRYAELTEIEEVLDASEFPIYSDYLKTKSRHLIDKKSIEEALDFSIHEYLKNSEAFDFLPIVNLCELINSLPRTSSFDYISCLILLDIYERESSTLYQELITELFEEFIESSGTFQPSRIFDGKEINEKEGYFLRNLCGPAQLDNIIQFADYDQVIHERVAILEILLTAGYGDVEGLMAEKDKVLETLFSEKLRAKIETGKLYVDVQALETHRRHIYLGLYEQAVSLEGGVNLEPLSEDSDTIDSTDLFQPDGAAQVAVVASKKSSILLKLYNQAVHDFALNENYGLDKYLSAEIRHIVFITQLRACFEKAELVTVQKNGEYVTNSFWTQKYNFVTAEIVDSIDIKLRKFSKEIDAILTKVNDRFRVNVGYDSSEYIFDFGPYHHRLVRVSEIVVSSNSYEIFFKGLIGYMWQLAIEGARSAEQVINDILLVEIIAAVENLEIEIQEIKGDVAMYDLMQAIKKSKTDLKKEIELVLNWFRFVGSDDLQTYERFGVVVEAAVSSFQSIFNHKGKELVFSQQRSDLRLNYSEARSLFISLFTALENALRYGLIGTSVLITHELDASLDRLIISNNIDDRISDPISFVKKHKEKWTSEYSSLSTAEGGSGLYKIHNLLTNSSKGFGFDISMGDGKFNAMMDLKHEYFTNRG